MPDELYCYPGSNVLKNKMGIQDIEQLHEIERKLTMLRILELLDKPVRGAFDLKHLQAIHAYIFQDVYDWAGELRKVDIRCLALHNGYVINFVNAGKDEMLEASMESFLCKYGAMESLFRKCLRKR